MKILTLALKYLKKYPLRAALIVAAILLCALFEGASFGMLIPLIQSMTQGSAALFAHIPAMASLSPLYASMGQAGAVSAIFVLLFILLLVKNVFIYITEVLIASLRFSVTRDLRVSLMGNLLEYDIGFFDGTKSGDIITVINSETERIGDFFKSVLQFIALSGKAAAYVTILFIISWKASIVIFLLMALVLWPTEFMMKRIKGMGAYISQTRTDYNHKLIEMLGGIRLIKSSGTEESEKALFASAANGVYSSHYESNRLIQLIIPLSEVCIFGLITACFIFLINFLKLDMARFFPFVATYLVVLVKTLTQVNALNGSRSDAVNRLAAFDNFERMHKEDGKRTIKSGNCKIDRFSRGIEFRTVRFAYAGGEDVLRDISVSIPMGKVTALVGPSGAGKSTMVNLIARFYDVTSGAILVDGIGLKDIELKGWRKKIGFVSQDIFIFNTTVKDNIAYGCDSASDNDIIKAAKASNSHEFIMNLPDGYDTVLGERGLKLSGGQKQRISIARAIMHRPEILILDEATSSLDTESERLITEAINDLAKERTVIAIAHRLSTILHADNIIVLDRGRVVEEGRHTDLTKRGGLYKRLYDVQFNVEKGTFA